MKRSALFLLAIVFWSCTAEYVETNPDFLPLENSRHEEFCNCKDSFEGEDIQLYAPNAREERLYQEVLSLIGLSHKIYFLCKAKKFPSDRFAAYATRKNNMRAVIYNEMALKNMDRTSAIHLLLHELGHLLCGHIETHSLWNSAHERELEADYFVGHGMYRMGFTLEEALSYNSDDRPATKTHPAGRLSNAAIKNAYLNAHGLETRYKGDFEKLETTADIEKKTVRVIVDSASIFRTVNDFIAALGDRRFKDAYALQNNMKWGSYQAFSAKTSFGGITSTSMISPPNLKSIDKVENNQCFRATVYAEYLATDPVNDACSVPGKLYKQYFEVGLGYDGWQIIYAKLLETICLSEFVNLSKSQKAETLSS